MLQHNHHARCRVQIRSESWYGHDTWNHPESFWSSRDSDARSVHAIVLYEESNPARRYASAAFQMFCSEYHLLQTKTKELENRQESEVWRYERVRGDPCL